MTMLRLLFVVMHMDWLGRLGWNEHDWNMVFITISHQVASNKSLSIFW